MTPEVAGGSEPSPSGNEVGRRARLTARLGSALRARPSVAIVLGLLVGQGVVYAVTPVLSRLYDPSEIGSAALFVAIAGAVGVLGTLRLDQRIAGCDDSELPAILRTALALSTVCSAGGAMGWAVWQGGGWLAGLAFFGASFGLGMTQVVSQLASREKRLHRFAASRAVAGLGQAGGQVGAGAAGLGGVGMLLGYGIGFLAGVASLGDRLVARMRPLPGSSRWASAEVLRLSGVVTSASLVNSLVVSAPPLLLATLYGAAEAGHFAMAHRLTIVPAGLVVSAITPVVASQIGDRLRSQQPVGPMVTSHLRKWLPVAAVVAVAPWVVQVQWVEYLLGSEWGLVVDYFRALSPMVASLVAVGPLSQVLTMTGRGKTQLIWDLSRFVVVFGGALLASIIGISAVALSALIAVLFCVFYAVQIYLAAKVDTVLQRDRRTETA